MHLLLSVSALRADTHGDLMSVRKAVAAETAATNAAVAAAATAAAAEAAAASKAAAAHDCRQNRYRGERAARPRRAHALEQPALLKEPGGGAGLMDGEDFSGGAVFEVVAWVRVLAATAPGLLPRLATSCGETKVTAFDPRTREYTGFGAGWWLLLGSAMGPRCAC